MKMVNVPPPPLSSTPPPIDFGEDDLDDGDEFCDFDLVTETHEGELSIRAPPLPRLQSHPEEPTSDDKTAIINNGITTSPAFDVDQSSKTAADTNQTVQAFNFQVKGSDKTLPLPTIPHEFDDFTQLAPTTPPPLTAQELDEEEEGELNTHDQLPSLKLDSLSLYSNESISASSTLSPVTGEAFAVPTTQLQPEKQLTKGNVFCHQVTLEDVSDDSDEECSTKKPKELFISEGAEDFFAIEIVGMPAIDCPQMSQINVCDNKEKETHIIVSEKRGNQAETCDIPEDNVKQLDASNIAPTSSLSDAPTHINTAVNEEDEDDFGDFTDFSALTEKSAIEPAITLNKNSETQLHQALDDGFDDFQEFASPAMPPTATNGDDSDDFGEFSATSLYSVVVPPAVIADASISVPPPPPPPTAHLSINERVKPVLNAMFPTPESHSSVQSKSHMPLSHVQTLQFSSIEQAHALDYQWSNSEIRHALVRALAIDSRNILFGEKWNASMPRFATNLSFDPLKPLKPLSADTAMPTLDSASVATTSSLVWSPTATTIDVTQTMEGSDSTAAQSRKTETQPGTFYGQKFDAEDVDPIGQNDNSADSSKPSVTPAGNDDDDVAAAPTAFPTTTAGATISITLPTDSDGLRLDGGEEQYQLQQPEQHQQLDMRANQPNALLNEIVTTSSYAVPLKETHIYTPSKSDTAVAKTTTLAPVDFDYEIASAGIIIDETVVKKEYRDVEYKPPPFGLDSPIKLNDEASAFDMSAVKQFPLAYSGSRTEDDDFSDFQSMPAPAPHQLKTTTPRNGTPTFGEQMILSPAILLPQAIPLAKPTIEWGDSSLASINAEELARIEELFPQSQALPTQRQAQAPTISATVAQHYVEDDDWSEFVSVPVPVSVQQQQQQHSNNNNLSGSKKQQGTPHRQQGSTTSTKTAISKDEDWSDFVSSTPLSTPQFNSGAWQSANFYNNPLSLYQSQQQHQQQPTHSNLVHKYQCYNNNNNSTSSNSSNNNAGATPQQIHIMHDFSTAPAPTPVIPATTYQQQHHQHHQQQQQQLQLQQRQHFQIGNAKVAPRISLIPDLSFVAPTLQTNNAGAFRNTLPKNSFSAKK
ncbi:uncharacterized protein LOC115621925 [Scaptodrosophila lebanonensis]|uniref:Uncharacterized protein LOC115621925 n=1 Tax=Drosophila lebanonensis TaxID=7225 RepID=A0A6J2T6I8_DROLE|nr:uncharacterized protein LOC115621925 [Scaptodrosophila lebanonensis]